MKKTNRLRSFARFKRIRRYGKNRDGSAAVEFGLVAPMFFALLIGLVEIGIVMFANEVLENAAEDTSRMLRTGEAKTTGMTPQQFKTALCGKLLTPMFACPSVTLHINIFKDFDAIQKLPNIVGPNGQLKPDAANDFGKPLEVVVMRVAYPWTIYGRFPGFNLANQGNHTRILTSTVVFRNEPYPDK